MTTDLDRIRAIKQAAEGRLLTIPGVHAVGIGSKIVGGQITTEPAIMVFVVKKKPLTELSQDEVIPDEIDGVKTDVYESDVPQILMDDTRYRPLVGGSQITPGALTPEVITHPPAPAAPVITPGEGLGLNGTLGCIFSSPGTSPKIIGLTCQHVIGIVQRAVPTNLVATTTSPTITFSGANTQNSLVQVRIALTGNPLPIMIFYRTSGADNLNTIANAVAARINAMAIAGLSAAAAGAVVTITAATLAGLRSKIYGAHIPNPLSDVHATVAGNVISITGKASRRSAAYVSLNLGGAHPTFGMFVHIASGDDATTVAASIASVITTRSLPGVTAVKTNPAAPGQPAIVTLTGVQEAQCDVSGDVRVGQPSNSFCSKCSKCCGDLIGVLIDARLDLDIALIQLAPAFVDKFRAEIEDIGVVRGIHDITGESTGYKLKTRGAATAQVRQGTLLAIDLTGDAVFPDPANTPPTWTLHHRFYTGAFSINGANFSQAGDSGSAVLTDSNPNSNSEVVGILFGGSATLSVATPIQQIIAAFPSLNLQIETATTTGVDLPVPALADAASREIEIAAAEAGEMPGPLMQQLQRVEQEIATTPVGLRYKELVQRHFSEVQTLVNSNRRVATAWHRNGGPRIVRGVIRLAQAPEENFPAEIDGKPLGECLAGIQNVISRYSSPDLAADLDEFGPPLAQLAGLNYTQALDALRSMRVD